jgi:hypothetical protein
MTCRAAWTSASGTGEPGGSTFACCHVLRFRRAHKYDFRVVLQHLGLIGDELKTARLHLTKKLVGSAAWKGDRRDRRPAQATRQARSLPSRGSARAPLNP